MRHKVPLSSLTPGRCFTLPVDPGEPAPASAEHAEGVRHAQPVLPPADAWKLTGEEDGALVAVNAAGETRTFPADEEVVEIPRQGYDRLAHRAS